LVHPTKRSLRASHSHRMAAAPDQLLLKTPNSKAATDWSSDGRFILYESQEPQTGADLWAVDLKEPRKQFPLVQTEFEEVNGQFSPDGKWIGYESNESGRFEIYVQPFSVLGEKLKSLSRAAPRSAGAGTVRHCCISRSMIGSPKCPFASVQADKW
jgi:roadblock/LC7 domain-containing protein